MSRFVSGGTNDEPTERDEAWIKAQQEIEAKQVQKAELGKQTDGKSLYETLQANKAAKQEQFEESIRLKNQFQSLNEDEVEFLDSVLESERAKEAAVKKQTRQELEAFRKQQEDAERATRSAGSPEAADAAETTSWHVNRKRKKGKEDGFRGLKLRKSSTADLASAETSVVAGSLPASDSPARSAVEASHKATSSSAATSKGKVQASDASASAHSATSETAKAETSSSPISPAPSLALGLAAYSSDEDG